MGPLVQVLVLAEAPLLGEVVRDWFEHSPTHRVVAVASLESSSGRSESDWLTRCSQATSCGPEILRWSGADRLVLVQGLDDAVGLELYDLRTGSQRRVRVPWERGTIDSLALANEFDGDGVIDLTQLPAGAWLRVDGGPALAAGSRLQLPAGKHTLELGVTTFQPVFRTFLLEPEGHANWQLPTLTPSREPTRRSWTPTVITAALGVLAVGVGSAAGGRALRPR